MGWIVLMPFALLSILYMWPPLSRESQNALDDILRLITDKPSFRHLYADLGDEFISVGLLVGLILTAFSKEKIEDEWVAKIRLESLLWSVYVNTGLVFLAILFLYSDAFLSAMIYNLFTTLIFFIIRFNFMIWSENRKMNNSLT
jgi:hypothetical protein